VVRLVDRPVRPHADFVGVLRTRQGGGGHAFADLDPLDRVDRHHRSGEVAVELAVERRAEAGGDAFRHHFDNRADGILRKAKVVKVGRPFGGGLGVGDPEGVPSDLGGVEAAAVDASGAHLHHVAGDPQPWHQRSQHLPGHPARRHARRGFAGAGAAAAARIADPVFLVVGDVGMAGAEGLRDLAVILGPLVGVLDHQLDRGAGGPAFEDTRKDADLVCLLALGGELRLAGLAEVEPRLEIGLGECHAGGAAVHRATDGRAVAFAPGGDPEDMSEGVEAHVRSPTACRAYPSRRPCRKPRARLGCGKNASGIAADHRRVSS